MVLILTPLADWRCCFYIYYSSHLISKQSFLKSFLFTIKEIQSMSDDIFTNIFWPQNLIMLRSEFTDCCHHVMMMVLRWLRPVDYWVVRELSWQCVNTEQPPTTLHHLQSPESPATSKHCSSDHTHIWYFIFQNKWIFVKLMICVFSEWFDQVVSEWWRMPASSFNLLHPWLLPAPAANLQRW